MTSNENHLQEKLHEDIPLTREMGIQVGRYDGATLVLQAPIAPNVNHKSTVFGGSLYSVAVLAGWGLIYLKLRELRLHGHIVIQHGDIDYKRPVAQDFEVHCVVPEAATFDRFVAMYQRKGRARLELCARINVPEGEAVVFIGTYVVHR